jgi:hypothetical protein
MEGKIRFPPPLFKKSPEDKNEGQMARRFDPSTEAKISAIRETTKLQREARDAQEISSSSTGEWTKPKQKDLTGPWRGQKVQDQNAAPKEKRATGALERTALYPLGVKPFNNGRAKDDDDTQFLVLEKVIAQQDKPYGDKETTGAERNNEHDANLGSLDDCGMGFARGTTSPLSLLGANDSDSIDMNLVDYSSEKKDPEANKSSGDKHEQEFTGDNILNGEQADKNEASHEISNTIKTSSDKGEREFTENENNCLDGERGDKDKASHEIINEAKKPVLTQQGIMDLIEHQASSKRTASSAGCRMGKKERRVQPNVGWIRELNEQGCTSGRGSCHADNHLCGSREHEPVEENTNTNRILLIHTYQH